MLTDRKRMVERMAANKRLQRQIVQEYGAFLRTLFTVGDWFVTLTFRDRYQDSPNGAVSRFESQEPFRRDKPRSSTHVTKCPSDPRIETWEPDSKHRREQGPPVRDAALREIEHWLLELGWEGAGRTRQEIFNRLADDLVQKERADFAKSIAGRCLICALQADPVTLSFYFDLHKIATSAIGWVIAEEFGRAGGRWHVHLLIRGVRHLGRRKWWKRAFMRFGRSRIEGIHE